jgi:hypothetical protein
MSNEALYLGTLEAAILIQHRRKPTHKETVFVEEKTADGEIVWQGHVESFDLTGHEGAKTCYAWQHIDSTGAAKIFAVLGSKFINSPNKAVQAAVFTDAQPPGHRFSKDLAAVIHAGQGIQEAIKQKRDSAS